VKVPPVRERDTVHRYFHNTDSPPRRAANYDDEGETPGVTATAKYTRQNAPLTGDGPPRRWFHTAAGEWIDLAQLGPVDWNVATANLANSVALLQPPFREDHTARAEETTAEPQQEPPADIAIYHAVPEEDAVWYPIEEEHTMSAGDAEMVERIPPLAAHTEGGRGGGHPSTPSAYD